MTETATPPTVRMRNFGIGEGSTVAISIASGIALLAAWWAVSHIGQVPRLFLPAPSEVLATAHRMVVEGYANASLWEHVSASLSRILVAAVIAIAIGIPVGLGMGLNRWAKGILDTPIEFYWPLPPLAYLPLMIIWLGIGETSKITLLTLAMLAPVVLSAQAGVRSLPSERVYAVYRGGAAVGAARNPDRNPHCIGRGLEHAGGRRADCSHPRYRLHDHVGLALSGHRCGVCRHCRDCRLCFCVFGWHAFAGAIVGSLEGQILNCTSPYTFCAFGTDLLIVCETRLAP